MSSTRLLLLRHEGVLWGVAQSAVSVVERPEDHGGGYRLRVGGEGGQELLADEVVGVIENVAIHPAGGVMATFWTEPAGGLALHGETPLVVVDPERPPSFLRPR